VEFRAHCQSVIGIYGAVTFLDVLNYSVFIDNDVGALCPLVGLIFLVVSFEDAVRGEHFLVHVAQQRKLDADLLREGSVGSGRINADSEDFRIRGIDLTVFNSRLDRLELFRSTTGEGENVDSKENIFLAVVITELDGLPLVAEQREIGSLVAHLERNFCDIISARRERRGGEQRKHGKQKTSR
jgi:hypothetical protein